MTLQPISSNERMPRYEQLAASLVRQIALGVYQPGRRLPSVRQASKEHGLSVTTVLQAYSLLESQGWVEARPQSGYYVSLRPSPAAPEPAVSAPAVEPKQVRIDELTLRVIHDAALSGVVQFGAALPNPDLLPTQKLYRLLAAAARTRDVRLNTTGVPEGIEELRVAVAQRALRAGAELDPGEVLITNGAMEASAWRCAPCASRAIWWQSNRPPFLASFTPWTCSTCASWKYLPTTRRVSAWTHCVLPLNTTRCGRWC